MFSFKGISSNDMGVVLEDEIFETSPDTNYEETEIDGRNGSIFSALNYKDIIMTKDAVLLNKDKAGVVKTWLSGTGQFIFNGKCKTARIYDGLDFEKHGPFKYSFPITFIFSPFWKLINDPYVKVTDKVINVGNINSEPMIKLVGTGSIDITVNDVRFYVDFDDDGVIEINCEEKSETKPNLISIGFNYPSLHPGTNKITVHAGTCEIYMKAKDRWI